MSFSIKAVLGALQFLIASLKWCGGWCRKSTKRFKKALFDGFCAVESVISLCGMSYSKAVSEFFKLVAINLKLRADFDAFWRVLSHFQLTKSSASHNLQLVSPWLIFSLKTFLNNVITLCEVLCTNESLI